MGLIINYSKCFQDRKEKKNISLSAAFLPATCSSWFIIPLFFLRRGTILASKSGLYEMSMPDDDQHTLKVFKVKTADIGEMMFIASNKYGNDSCTFNVEMAGRQQSYLPT